MTGTGSSRTGVALAGLVDLVLVVGFAAVGRASHETAAFGIGLAQTAWPFVVALAVGWLITVAWRNPLALWPTGIGVWVLTVVGGMLLRALSGQGTALPFIIVATLTLALLLLGWRLIAVIVRRVRARRVTG